MARLSIEQIRAPNLSVASQATARAGESFQKGMSSASDLLNQYQSGIEESGDAEIFQEIAQLGSEEEYNAFINGPALANRPMSAAMRTRIMAGRGVVLGYEQDRATRRGTDASTGLTHANTGRVNNATRIATNVDNRAGRTSDYNFGALQDGNQIGALAAAAQAESLRSGNVSGLAPENVSGLAGTNTGPRIDGSGIALPVNSNTVRYRDGIAAIESDGSGGYRAVGATHETLGRALGRYQIMEANIPAWSRAALGREVSVEEFLASDDIQDAIFDHKFGGYVKQFGEEGAAQAWFGGAGGVGKTERTDVHGRLTIGDYGNNFVSNIGGNNDARQPVTTNPNGQRGPAAAALQAALADPNFRMTPAQRLALGQNNYDTAVTGQNAINAADNASAAEFAASQRLTIADDPDIVTSTEAIVAGNQSAPGATALETEANRAAILAGLQEGNPLGVALLAGTDQDPETTAIAQGIIAERAAAVQRSPTLRAAAGAISFEASPAESLAAAMKGLNISTTPSEIEAAINQLARDAGVSRGEAAYSFARAAEDNSGFNAAGIFTPGGNNLSEWKAYSFAQSMFTGDGAQEARQTLRDYESQDRDTARLSSAVQTARARAQKSANANGGTAEPRYVRAYERAATALDAAVEESIIPDDRIVTKKRTSSATPTSKYNSTIPNNFTSGTLNPSAAAEIQSYLDGTGG